MKKYEAPDMQAVLFAPVQDLAAINLGDLINVGNTQSSGKGDATIISDGDIKINI